MYVALESGESIIIGSVLIGRKEQTVESRGSGVRIASGMTGEVSMPPSGEQKLAHLGKPIQYFRRFETSTTLHNVEESHGTFYL